MSERKTLILRETEIRSLLDPASCVDAVEKAFTAYATGKAELPNVINLNIPEHLGEIHVKAGYLHSGPYYAVKMAWGFLNNPRIGMPANDAMILVFDSHTGALAALLLDKGYITDLRTGAAGAVAAKYLARHRVDTVAIIGSGGQARYQTRLLALVRQFHEVRIWGRQAEKAAACVQDLSRDDSLSHCKFVVSSSIRAAVDGADVVITVTASREPLVQAAWIAKGALVTALGSDGPDKQELDVDLLSRADKIVADSLEQCLRLGEIHHAVSEKAISKDKITAELGQITAGIKPGRTSEDEIIVCDLTGVGVQDVAGASVVVERALQAGIGEPFSL